MGVLSPKLPCQQACWRQQRGAAAVSAGAETNASWGRKSNRCKSNCGPFGGAHWTLDSIPTLQAALAEWRSLLIAFSFLVQWQSLLIEFTFVVFYSLLVADEVILILLVDVHIPIYPPLAIFRSSVLVATHCQNLPCYHVNLTSSTDQTCNDANM